MYILNCILARKIVKQREYHDKNLKAKGISDKYMMKDIEVGQINTTVKIRGIYAANIGSTR